MRTSFGSTRLIKSGSGASLLGEFGPEPVRNAESLTAQILAPPTPNRIIYSSYLG